jgi:predicted hotdog family 3-hydroxylacyl-ACP dehydratase
MTTPSFSDLTLEDLLPQRGDMLLIQEILEVDKTEARTLCRPKPSWPMADAGGVPPLILVELAAQTAGVCNGWDRIQTKGIDSEQMGWLVGIKKADFSIDHLPFGCDIISRARNTFRFDKLREVACKQHIGDRLISRITLQLYQANTDE